MESEMTDRAWLTVIGQAACLIAGALLIVAASVLFAALMIADHPNSGMAITALLNAAMFYLWGLGCIRYVYKSWRGAEARLAAGKPSTDRAD